METKDNKHHFEWKVETSKGLVTVRAEAEIKAHTLVLHDLCYSPEGKKKSGLHNEMQEVKSEFESRLRGQGFTGLELTDTLRVSGINPGRELNPVIDLTKGNAYTVQTVKLHSDPAVQYEIDKARLQAVQTPYKTKQALELSQAQKGKNQFGQFLQRNPQIEKTQQQPKEKALAPKSKGKGLDYE